MNYVVLLSQSRRPKTVDFLYIRLIHFLSFCYYVDNHLIMADFNIEPNNRMFKSFLDSNNLQI